MLGTSLQDTRYAIAILLKRPGFSIVAVLGLTLGIGATTAIFSVVNALLLQPLPYKDPARLVSLKSLNTHDSKAPTAISYPNFVDWRDQSHAFDGMAAYSPNDMNLTGRGDPERLRGAQCSYDLFSLLGVTPVTGRFFLPEEDRPKATPVAVLGFGLWQRLFAGDREAIGKSITLDGVDAQIVGVLPPGFKFIQGVEIWTPLAMENDPNARLALGLEAVGRLKPGKSLSQAQEELEGIAAGLAEQYPATNKNWSVTVTPLQDEVVGKFRPALLLLLGAVGLVLLISCTNVANLLLAQGASRRKEIAIRLAIGAGRFRIARQLLTESVVLGVVGGALGVGLAAFGVRALTSLSSNIPRVDEIGINVTVLCFAAGISILTGIVFGMVPALQATRTDLTESLKEAGKGFAGGGPANRLRSVLVVSEVAFALTLLVGAGLLLKSFSKLQGVGLGFRSKGIVTFDVQLPDSKYKNEGQIANFYYQTLAGLKAIPGVEDAAATFSLPLSGNGALLLFYGEGRPAHGPEDYTAAYFDPISPDYFRTMGIPLLEGRDISDRDKGNAPPVTVVSESFAKRFFPGQDAVGKRIKLGARPDSPRPWITIIGVAADTKHNSVEDPRGEATMYLPCLQRPEPVSAFVVRTAGDLTAMSGAFKNAVLGVDPDQAIANVKTLDQVLLEYSAQRRLIMLLLLLFAIVAVLLASLGVYGVMAYSVTQRSHEFGIRLALGARRSAVLAMVIRRGLVLAGAGVFIGIGASFGLTRLMASLLFDVSATDPIVFVGVAAVISAVALMASLVPAMKATTVDPMITLRYE